MKHLYSGAAALALTFALFSPQAAMAHCQVPCGIYADDNVFEDLKKDHETILKAMTEIEKLSADPAKNIHQITRWVANKESHAQSIQDTVGQYFLAQRVKLGEENKGSYLQKLELLHEVIVYAMKCKQKLDVENADKLLASIEAFEKLYKAK
ncbi:superoxide dismutase [Ni] [Rubritalea marina]|uniref:superoxide dismutase [Ni] n=1 Tax=Rubritalea marina TaxID=361055 RepID=UPI000367A269|nr:superoxide dismutase [Ni] [Rubritalea marina]